MVYRTVDIARDVRRALDENVEGGAFLEEGDIDTLSLEGIVKSKIEEAAGIVVSAAPAHLLSGAEPVAIGADDAVYWRGDGRGWFLLPDDFLRLLAFKMSDWERPVHEVIVESDPRYALQSSRCRGLRGTPQKPVVAVVRRQGGLALEFYSCRNEEATVEQALYMKVPRVEKDAIELPERCYKAVVYLTAALASATVGDVDRSTIMREMCKEAMI